MTRKEAASKLKEIRVPFPDIKNINYEALDVAIEVLEKEQKTDKDHKIEHWINDNGTWFRCS